MDRSLEPIHRSLLNGEFGLEDLVSSDLMTMDFDFSLPTLSQLAWHVAWSFVAGNKQPAVKQLPERVRLAIAGRLLPVNFQKQIAPYLGVGGWVLETEQDGWRATGCVLKLE